ncbi:TPR in aerotolerance operon domain protein, partial [Vibrio parahaemolyticus V-223/04]
PCIGDQSSRPLFPLWQQVQRFVTCLSKAIGFDVAGVHRARHI